MASTLSRLHRAGPAAAPNPDDLSVKYTRALEDRILVADKLAREERRCANLAADILSLYQEAVALRQICSSMPTSAIKASAGPTATMLPHAAVVSELARTLITANAQMPSASARAEDSSNSPTAPRSGSKDLFVKDNETSFSHSPASKSSFKHKPLRLNETLTPWITIVQQIEPSLEKAVTPTTFEAIDKWTLGFLVAKFGRERGEKMKVNYAFGTHARCCGVPVSIIDEYSDAVVCFISEDLPSCVPDDISQQSQPPQAAGSPKRMTQPDQLSQNQPRQRHMADENQLQHDSATNAMAEKRSHVGTGASVPISQLAQATFATNPNMSMLYSPQIQQQMSAIQQLHYQQMQQMQQQFLLQNQSFLYPQAAFQQKSSANHFPGQSYARAILPYNYYSGKHSNTAGGSKQNSWKPELPTTNGSHTAHLGGPPETSSQGSYGIPAVVNAKVTNGPLNPPLANNVPVGNPTTREGETRHQNRERLSQRPEGHSTSSGFERTETHLARIEDNSMNVQEKAPSAFDTRSANLYDSVPFCGNSLADVSGGSKEIAAEKTNGGTDVVADSVGDTDSMRSGAVANEACAPASAVASAEQHFPFENEGQNQTNRVSADAAPTGPSRPKRATPARIAAERKTAGKRACAESPVLGRRVGPASAEMSPADEIASDGSKTTPIKLRGRPRKVPRIEDNGSIDKDESQELQQQQQPQQQQQQRTITPGVLSLPSLVSAPPARQMLQPLRIPVPAFVKAPAIQASVPKEQASVTKERAFSVPPQIANDAQTPS
ncbi:hypothetical protein HDU83_008951, partial [Entophlyctis luteolus]